MNTAHKHPTLSTVLFLLAWISGTGGRSAQANEPPIAEAGPSRYAARQSLPLDGTKSYDPDNSGSLTYTWTQVSGPPLVITRATTATPTISGFVQTQQIQECQFRLLVDDGQQTSSPDTVKVVIVPDFGPRTLILENESFDPSKPTVIYFGGGDCITGTGTWNDPAWANRANVISGKYSPDDAGGVRSYYQYGDVIIAYLSAVAPDYRQPIQTIGWSTGADPAIDVGIRLNTVYRDARYAVNRVTHLDGGCRWEGDWSAYLEAARLFLTSSVDGEQCWIDHYYGSYGYVAEPTPRIDILWVRTALAHDQVQDWYRNSVTAGDATKFNDGMVAGAYWSVVGPGRNLQLASTPGVYYFLWNGTSWNGVMNLFSLLEYPGRLPEPVTLLDRQDPRFGDGDPNGVILTCKESKNAVGYELLLGSDPFDVANYHVVLDSNSPPMITAAMLPSSDAWWTVRVRDAWGSTIYADPVRVGYPVGLIAYWKLDEAQGAIAYDSADGHHANVVNGSSWQPQGGKVRGALQFDGTDDVILTPYILNPSQGSFSVFLWLKGGTAGQVVLSQVGGANWLRAAPVSGTLQTELNEPGRNAAKHLGSTVVITDGNWHRVGLVWDGVERALYVDDVEVARGTLMGLPDSPKGLYIGAGSTLAPGTFWSGLIDDVRIYNRTVKP